MNSTIRYLVVMFAVMFFAFAGEEALAQVMQCYESGGVTRCMTPDGRIVTIITR